MLDIPIEPDPSSCNAKVIISPSDFAAGSGSAGPLIVSVSDEKSVRLLAPAKTLNIYPFRHPIIVAEPQLAFGARMPIALLGGFHGDDRRELLARLGPCIDGPVYQSERDALLDNATGSYWRSLNGAWQSPQATCAAAKPAATN